MSLTQQLELFQTANIVLETPMKINQKGYKNNPIFLKNQEKVLNHFFHNCVINLKLEIIMLNYLMVLKEELYQKE
ncbi:hypothetical protein MW871_10825 [Flavobacterium sp. I-SCBP12n]|uniref:Uncharacterized protein n=1 Tax=Flavobacterium pygoscelis TaxID=2893176 RepID=A0A9X1XS90_9FLAO|nr:hypothetical protein [Flavobacterium pygoscelis]MCK8142384.1 hypothetical protein [Flavobacterium pygoscelis]